MIDCMRDRIFVEITTARFRQWYLEKLGAWSLGLVVFKHSNWNFPQSAESQTCGDSKSRIFWWFYFYGITSYFIWVMKCAFIHSLKCVYNIISKSESKGGYILETEKFPILDIYPWSWNHHPSMQTIIHVFFWFSPILLQSFIWKCKQYPPNIINNHLYRPPWFFPYSIAILHLA